MAILGIVAELNPYHHGHKYLIDNIRKKADFDGVVAVMSGNFLQRGEPALCNKWSRAKMALNGGVDLIIELPVCYAARSAYFFARGAIQLLSAAKAVTHLGFGSEAGNLDLLGPIAQLLADEPPELKTLLHESLSTGNSFASARAYALKRLLPDPHIDQILSLPNNILALEYLRVLREYDDPMQAITVARQGDFHSLDLAFCASAGAIRQALYDNRPLSDLVTAMPSASWNILKHELEAGRVVTSPQIIASLILYQLRTLPVERLAAIYDINEGLENRMKKAALLTANLNDLRFAIKTKRYSMTHINRVLLYTLLHMSKNQIEYTDSIEPPYLNILGFSTRGEKILQEIKNKSSIIILNRGKDVKAAYEGKYGDKVKNMIHWDVMATDIYSLLYPEPEHRRGGFDFITSPARLSSEHIDR